MPIKGIIFLLLIAVVMAIIWYDPIYAKIKDFFVNEKDEDE